MRLILVNLTQALITAYQKYIRPAIPATCRFEPSCSEYAKQAILKYGIIKGVFKGITRICRCHPFCSRSSYDPLV
ncbi:MAG: membrane protein insertion efficiency factor YidD [Candidatus Omnitrophica bacterium]|nr:membrane protein insertion efficiency factor YidD [Candidatus Omnitrophota bacterium]MDO9572525.1 membrane protein insertion efficiency factor YidD [Candidatus Omnitrophota bacterium]